MNVQPPIPACLNLARIVAFVHGLYILIGGAWPIADMGSFMAVTGPKTDEWLVNTVGLLLMTIGAALILAAWRASISREIVLIAVGECFSVGYVAFHYAMNGRISELYFIDAAFHALVAIGWLATGVRLHAMRSASA